MRHIILALFLVGCGVESTPSEFTDLVPLDAHTMLPGERLAPAHFIAVDGDIVSFAVIGSNLQPLAVGVAYEGPPETPTLHRSYAWLGASQTDPYADATPAPLVGGAYRVELGCGEEAALPCVFTFKAWLAVH